MRYIFIFALCCAVLVSGPMVHAYVLHRFKWVSQDDADMLARLLLTVPGLMLILSAIVFKLSPPYNEGDEYED